MAATFFWHQVIILSVLLKFNSGLKFVAIGDWGDDAGAGVERQKEIARTMDTWCGRNGCQFIVDTGDNFYPQGVTSVDDVRFDTSWKSVYNLPNIADKQWFISLGNNDHDDEASVPQDQREQYQVLYHQKEPRWYLPWLWYELKYEHEGTTIHLITIDSQSIKIGTNQPAAQLAWLENTLAGSTADWKIVVSHHQAYSVGAHGPTGKTMVSEVVPIILEQGADVFLSGHEHNLEHIIDTNIDYVISGGGAKKVSAYNADHAKTLNDMGMQVGYFGYHNGFVAFDISSTQLTVHYINETGNVLYSFTRTK